MSRKGNALLSLAAGFGSGYLGAQRQTKLDEERQADRAMRREEHDARMGEVNEQKKLRVSLADAARPAAVEEGAGGAIRPATMDDRDVGLPENANLPNGGLSLASYRVKDKSFDTKPAAEAEVAAYNAPDARRARQVDALDAAGKPAEAMTLANATAVQRQNQAKFTQEQLAQAQKMKSEGFIEAAKASRTGDPQAVFEAFNRSGTMKLTEPPTVTPAERELPGIGKVQTFDYVAKVMGPDGTPREVKVNSHDLSMQTLPYEKVLELGRRGVDSDRKFENQNATLALKEATLDAKTAAAAAKAAAGGGAGSGGKIQKTFVDGSGYMVGVFRDGTTKRLTGEGGEPIRADSVEKRVDALAKNLAANSREYRRMPAADVRAAAKAILLGEAESPAPSLADAMPRAPAAGGRAPVPASAKPDFSNLWTK